MLVSTVTTTTDFGNLVRVKVCLYVVVASLKRWGSLGVSLMVKGGKTLKCTVPAVNFEESTVILRGFRV